MTIYRPSPIINIKKETKERENLWDPIFEKGLTHTVNLNIYSSSACYMRVYLSNSYIYRSHSEYMCPSAHDPCLNRC